MDGIRARDCKHVFASILFELKFIFVPFRINVSIRTATLRNEASVIRPQKVKQNKREIERHHIHLHKYFIENLLYGIHLSMMFHKETGCEESNKCNQCDYCSTANLVRLKEFC